MTLFQIKEANRYYWIVKGRLIPDGWSEKDIMAIYESYFARIWGNHEAASHRQTLSNHILYKSNQIERESL